MKPHIMQGKSVTSEELENIRKDIQRELIIEEKERTTIKPTMMIMDNNEIKEIEVESAIHPLSPVDYPSGNKK
ncbi:hypothetical protein [Clostridium sp. JNZ J1-5]